MLRGVSYPKTDARDEPTDGYVPVLRATNIQDARLVLQSDLVHIAARNISPEQLLRQGDIVVATSSGSKHLVGKSARLHDDWRGSFGAFCAAIRPRANIDSRFLALYLQSPHYWRQVTGKALGVNINNLRRGDLETLVLPLPPEGEQRRIVAEIEKQFSRLDEAVANLKRVKANLKRYKAAVLKAAVEGRLVSTEAALARREGRGYESAAKLLRRIDESHRLQGRAKGQSEGDAEPDRAPLPAGWAWANIAQVGQVISGLTKNPKRIALASKLPYLRVANVYANELRLHEIEHIGVAPSELEKLLLRNGDLLIVEGNGSPSQLGRVAMWDGSIDPCVHQNHIIKLRLQLVNPRWVLNWLLSPGGRSEIEQVGSSTSGLHTLSTGKVAQLPVPLPPLAEQDRIISEIDRCLSIVRGVEAEIDSNLKRAQTLRQATLSRAFSPPPVTVVGR